MEISKNNGIIIILLCLMVLGGVSVLLQDENISCKKIVTTYLEKHLKHEVSIDSYLCASVDACGDLFMWEIVDYQILSSEDCVVNTIVEVRTEQGDRQVKVLFTIENDKIVKTFVNELDMALLK